MTQLCRVLRHKRRLSRLSCRPLPPSIVAFNIGVRSDDAGIVLLGAWAIVSRALDARTFLGKENLTENEQ